MTKMSKCCLLLLNLLFFCQYLIAQSSSKITVGFNKLEHTHSILLSPWGPYSKKYAGISNIPNMQQGLRFDFAVSPGLYHSKMVIPNVLMRSDYYPWKVNNNLTSYTFRNELEWKDRIYVDVSYHIIDSATTLVAIRCVNNTDLPQNMDLNLISSVDYPENYSSHTISPSKHVLWKNAVDYETLVFAKQRPTDDLVNNGWMRGEVRDTDYIDGRGIGGHFGRDKGDKLTYNLPIAREQLVGNLSIRYQMKVNTQGTFHLNGMINQTITLKGHGNFEWKTIPYTLSTDGPKTLTLESENGSEITLNGLLITTDKRETENMIIPQIANREPDKIKNLSSPSIILKYKDIPTYYGIAWDQDYFKIREVKNDDLDVFFRKLINDRAQSLFTGNGKGDYTDIYTGPLKFKAHEVKTVYAMLCTGSLETVKKKLTKLKRLKDDNLKKKNIITESGHTLPQGKKYELSQHLLKATLMTNIVYPIYTQNSYILHFTPGKWWNSIYTWDLGFIALGLNEINPNLAAECINAYTTPLGSQSAFILHGSPVPMQIYAFYDLWNKTQSQNLLSYFYPRLRKYYTFLAGEYGSSDMRKLKSNLLSTWNYFYNSGGWDDYPPQVALHLQKAESTTAPVINTAQCIRIAKMLRMAATSLNKQEDVKMYDEDIKTFSNALQKYSWNSTSGYFSYVVHDKNGYPIGPFKDLNGIDYNMGLDGAYPLVSGICTPAQEKDLIEKIFSPKYMWTSAGISVVDQSAPYYEKDGYWNGSVWMPHQWFFWKTMLDIGRPDLAFKIAKKALDVYKTEADDSYCTFEHFFPETGRGEGWHQFSGLSTPVLSWFSTYYRIGAVTSGFEIWINHQSFNNDSSAYKATLSFDGATLAHKRSMIVCMSPLHQYHITFNGKSIPVNSPYPGLVQLTFPATNQEGTLIIKPIVQ